MRILNSGGQCTCAAVVDADTDADGLTSSLSSSTASDGVNGVADVDAGARTADTMEVDWMVSSGTDSSSLRSVVPEVLVIVASAVDSGNGNGGTGTEYFDPTVFTDIDHDMFCFLLGMSVLFLEHVENDRFFGFSKIVPI